MNKSVMLSIHPNWCERIIRGYKTIEVRKTKPKLETPFKCYIYCTKDKLTLLRDDEDKEEQYKFDVWKHAGFHESFGRKVLNGKVIGEFVCDGIIQMSDLGDFFAAITDYDITSSCLNYDELHEYGKGKDLYGWHISDLKIYDEPKEIYRFYKPCNFNYDCFLCDYWVKEEKVCTIPPITKPPQSWCYVRKVGDRE